MHAAAFLGHELLCAMLHHYGGDVAARSERMWTPLHFAAFFGHTKVRRADAVRQGVQRRVESRGASSPHRPREERLTRPLRPFKMMIQSGLDLGSAFQGGGGFPNPTWEFRCQVGRY
jgi:ankyrin repeat protein